MVTPELITLLGQFGAPGLMVAYLIWDKKGSRQVEVARADADKALAASLAALTVTIQQKFGEGGR